MSIVIILFALYLFGSGVAALHSPATNAVLYGYTLISGSPLHFEVQVTPLSGLFLAILGCLGALAGLYGIGYGQEYEQRHFGLWLDLGLLIFLSAMALVFCAANVLTFMGAWEGMSIASYLLVVFEHEKKGVIRAGLLYAGMTQLGSAFLLIGFLVLHQYTGSYDFAVYARVASTLPPAAQSLVFLCTLIGFSTKAGLMPLHIWLPEAHPIAPSHISALMSGVMIKTAVFGLMVVGIVWLHGTEVWWGALVAALGAISAVQGAFWSGQEGSIKRILAFSSIDQIGLIFLAIGMSMLEWGEHEPLFAAVALTAAMLLALNHALFKSTLFQGAGAVIFACHTGMLDRLGGLFKRLPVSSIGILLALSSLCALPPFGGFASEWLLFSMLTHVAALHLHSWLGLLAVIALLALFTTGALTLLSAVRFFAIGFLAQPRTRFAETAHEVPISMRVSIIAGGVLTLVSGLMTPWLLRFFVQALPNALQQAPNLLQTSQLLMPPDAFWMIAGVVLASAMCIWLLSRLAGKKARVTSVPTWTCGAERTARMSYTATGLSQPVRRAFTFAMFPLAQRYLYRPGLRLVVRTTTSFRTIQNGHVRTYLLYLFSTAVVLLLIARLGGY